MLWMTQFIEEVLRLPEELHRKLFFERVTRKEKAMEFTTYAERVGEKKGIKKGKLKGKAESVLQLLEMRFKQVPEDITAKVSNLTNTRLLNRLFEAAFRCESLKEFEAQLPTK